MNSVFENSPVPRYAQLAGLLRQRIARGVWHVGQKLPSLEELVGEFNVARVTVRQAVALLTQEGLLSPQQGRGTFVTAKPGQDRSLRLETSLRDLAEAYRSDSPQLTLLEEAGALPALQASDGLAAPAYQFMRRVHARAGEPYCVLSIYLDARVFSLAPQRFRTETVIPVMLDLPQVKIAKARQTLHIASADVEVARQLGIAVNAPVAEVRRLCHSADGTLLYLGEVTYRGDYIHFEMALTT